MTQLGEAHHHHATSTCTTMHGMNRKNIQIEGNMVGYPASPVCSLESRVRFTGSSCITVSLSVLMEEMVAVGSERGRKTTTESSFPQICDASQISKMTEYRISYFHSRSDHIFLLLLLFMEAFLSSAYLASRWTKMSRNSRI